MRTARLAGSRSRSLREETVNLHGRPVVSVDRLVLGGCCGDRGGIVVPGGIHGGAAACQLVVGRCLLRGDLLVVVGDFVPGTCVSCTSRKLVIGESLAGNEEVAIRHHRTFSGDLCGVAQPIEATLSRRSSITTTSNEKRR